MELFGITFVGLNSETLRKLLLTAGLIVIVGALRDLVGAISERVLRAHPNESVRF